MSFRLRASSAEETVVQMIGESVVYFTPIQACVCVR